MKIQKLTLLAGVALLTSVSFGQKKNETSAAVEFKNKFLPELAQGNKDNARKALLTSKEYIDLAAEHPDTKESSKTLYYKGEIYSASLTYVMATMDTSVIGIFGEDAMDVAIEAFTKSYNTDKRYRSDIENSVGQKVYAVSNMAHTMYEAENFNEAAELYKAQYELSTAINALDSTALYYSSICYEKANKPLEAAEGYEVLAKAGYKGAYSYALAGSMFSKAKEFDKAKAILNEGRAKYGTDKDLLLELVKINIAQGDNQGAETALNDAIASDPNNKQLHYIIGTIYTDLGKNEEAENALNKALEIDPNYLDAQYNLGAHVVTWGSTLKQEANAMKLGDPNYEPTLQKSEDTFKRALIPLEKYIEAEPKDANVLQILYQLHYNLGNTDKYKMYKERFDAAK